MRLLLPGPEARDRVSPMAATPVTLIPGDGIGREVVGAAQRIVDASGAPIEWDERQAGAEVFKQGLPSGVPQDTIDSISRTRVVLKGPLETPVGFGEKSANVTLRKLFETYANIRPAREFPGVPTPYSGRGIDLVVVRENVEDLYAGIEHMQTPGVAQCLKVISRKGCEKIVRLAFEFARAEGRSSVACATKSNIMKLTEGLLKRTFEEIAPEYPEIESWHVIVDNAAHQLVKRPEQFDVIVTTNMNGDILSDLTSALVGGLGFAPSANLGSDVAIFEAVHGSAPKYAGKNSINPTAMIGAAVMMLRHLQMFDQAAAIENALLVTLEQGTLTRDVVGDEGAASTTGFTDAIIANLGNTSPAWPAREYRPLVLPDIPRDPVRVRPAMRRVVGVDVFVEFGGTPDELGQAVERLVIDSPVALKIVDNRGTRVYPATGTPTDCVDAWRCRFIVRDPVGGLSDSDLLTLLSRMAESHRFTHVEKLHEFDGQPGFSKAQGED
jgi:isocitrate dehydrogenase